ncbi:uncharacterized protein LOC130665467 [Microplitis mediator]|uniref:uncharacterized protein LOC130665467 n=1 Tax=Microplitis mediator TaxID=375433 RepID=UPI002552BC62|nr:uncharacterized protein LOC130665467 [Microplitis mediator]
MASKAPRLLIKIDKLIRNRSDSNYNSNTEYGCIYFHTDINNSFDVASYSTVDDNHNLNNYSEENLLHDLNEILTEDLGDSDFFAPDINGCPTSPVVCKQNDVSTPHINDYTDCSQLDCPPIVVSSSQISFPCIQEENKQISNDVNPNNQLIDTEYEDYYSLETYTSNSYHCNSNVSSNFSNMEFNSSKSLCLQRDLRASVMEMTIDNQMSTVDPEICKNNNYVKSLLQKELKVVVKKLTGEELSARIHASNNKNTMSWKKELKVSLKKMTDSEIINYTRKNKSSRDDNLNGFDMTHDSGYFESSFISNTRDTIEVYQDPDADTVLDSLIKLFSNIDDNTDEDEGLAGIDCSGLDDVLNSNESHDVLYLNESRDDQPDNLNNEENSVDLNYSDDNLNGLQKNVEVESKKNNSNNHKKRKIKDKRCEYRCVKKFVYDFGLLGFNDNGEAFFSDDLVPQIKSYRIYESEEVTIKRSIRIETSSSHKIIFVGKIIVNDSYRQSIESIGGKIVDDPKVATVLVAKKISRTVEFLSAICRSIPIVSVQWIEDSFYNRKFVDPKNYLLKDTVTEKRYGFRLETSLERAKKKRIFEGYTFVITSGIQKMSFDQLKYLIDVAGGRVFKSRSKIWRPHTILVSCSNDRKKAEEMFKRKPDYYECVVKLDFIIASLLKQQIHTNQYALKFNTR